MATEAHLESTLRRKLVLLCGLLCDDEIWEGVRQRLTEVADVQILNFPGFSSITGMAEHVLASAPEKFALAGHSMGGRVALEVYRQAPARVRGLALLNTGVHPAAPAESATRRDLVQIAHTQGMKALAARWLPPMLGREYPTDDPLILRLTRMIERASPDSFAAQIEALLGRPDARSVLPMVSVPTVLCSAQRDSWSPPRQHADMRELCPLSKLVIIPNAGHMAPAEQPEAVALALTEWLNRVADLEHVSPVESIERLLIADACERLIHRYGRLNDAGAWEALVSLFSHDGVLFRPSEPDTAIKGRSALLASLQSRPSRYSRHIVTNIEVFVESGKRAHAISSVILYVGGAGGGSCAIGSISVGRFEDCFVKSEEQWRFAERRGSIVMRCSLATEEG